MTDDPNAGAAGYAGQFGLGDDASMFNAVMFIVQSVLGRARTCVLVKVMAIEAAGEVAAVGMLDAMPLVNQVDGIGNSTPHATIFNLPYFRMQGGSNAIIMDPQVGDIGVAVIADRDSSAVKSTKGQANPGSKRRFDLADGMYFGGFLNGVPDQYIQFTDDGVKVSDKNGNVVNMVATGIELTPSSGLPVTVNGNIVVTGNIELGGQFLGQTGAAYPADLKIAGEVYAKWSGTVAGSSVSVSGHKHTQPADSHGDTEAQTNAPTGGT